MFPNQCQAIDSNHEQCAYTMHTDLLHTFDRPAVKAAEDIHDHAISDAQKLRR